jgi:hypothetical protein
MTRIIGFTGKKGVGKNFVAALVEEVLKEPKTKYIDFLDTIVEQGALADPIKEFCFSVLGLDKDIMYGNDDAKNATTEYRWEKMPQWLRSSIGVGHGPMTYRQIMQIVGTELGRDVWDKEIWVKALHRKIHRSGADYFLVTDVRFPNEVDAVKAWGGKVWKIDGPQRGAVKKTDSHASENALNNTAIDFDAVIMNNLEDDKESLKAKVRQALELQEWPSTTSTGPTI